ncbi:hypothetical protein [Frondihabitans australicus]|uniref:Uncharacterized protein n=1 Tax=Frondihabitans australicus TaxID=386892 RepID=A0A495IAI9_9MICO|nr:hypothetical protein [Frondihabitans australicus]RKR73024.1 hypothetical protein C8E83_0106 [Frondihabitans australicus]
MPPRSQPACRSLVAAASLLAVGACSLIGATPASAEPVAITQQQVAGLHARMDALGVPAQTQVALVAKIEAGSIPDSARPDAVPVSSSSADDGASVVDVFADGSRRTMSTEGADDGAPSIESSKSGCLGSGGWNTNCKISISDIFSNASFVVDYQTSSSGKAKVRDVRSARCANTIGGCSVSASVKRATQSSAGPAWAELTYKADVVHIGSGVSGAFGIRVSGTSVSLYG